MTSTLVEPKQFIKLPTDECFNKLKPVARVAWSALYDRLHSSNGNRQFYYEKWDKYYVIFSREEMADYLGVSIATVTSIYKQLKSAGLLLVKKVFNGSDLLFPKMTDEMAVEVNSNGESQKTSRPKVEKVDSNQTDPSQREITNNTINTDNQIFESLKSSLATKSGMPVDAVNSLASLSYGSYENLYHYAGLMLKAKSAVRNTAKSQNYKYANESTFFETNHHITDHLAENIQRIILTAKRATNNDNWFDKYVVRSFITFFEQAANAYAIA